MSHPPISRTPLELTVVQIGKTSAFEKVIGYLQFNELFGKYYRFVQSFSLPLIY